MMKFLEDEFDHENPVQRRMLQLIEAHQIRESLLEKFISIRLKSNLFLIKEKINSYFRRMIWCCVGMSREKTMEIMVSLTIYGLGHLELLKFWKTILSSQTSG